ncbi:MAG: helix-turn-helix domain-containing protein [Novosphingobium sp.]|nr:helix-turn-helix domain-containing protein [Novosphingobium sp.]
MGSPGPALVSNRPGRGKLVGATVSTIAILRHLYGASGPLRLIEISGPLSLNRSTAFNILRTLAHEGVVTFDPAAKTYFLQPDFGEAMMGGGRTRDRERRLEEGMARLAQLYKINVTRWAVRGERLVLTAVAESPAPVKLSHNLGQRIPLLQGAVGRAVAAAMPLADEDIAALFARTVWQMPQDLDTLIADIHRTRRRGWADDGGSVPPGTRALAVALRDDAGTVEGGCAVLLFAGQYKARDERAIVAALEQICADAR